MAEISLPTFRQGTRALDAHQRQALAAVALFNNLVGQAHQRALNLRGRHQSAFQAQTRFVFGFAHGRFLAAIPGRRVSGNGVSRRMIRGVTAPSKLRRFEPNNVDFGAGKGLRGGGNTLVPGQTTALDLR